MAIKLTESRLRQIIREEARRLVENQGARKTIKFRLGDNFNYDILDLAETWTGVSLAEDLSGEDGLNKFMDMVELTSGGKPVDAATELKVKSELAKEVGIDLSKTGLGKTLKFRLGDNFNYDILDLAEMWTGVSLAEDLSGKEGLDKFMDMVELTRGGKPVDPATELKIKSALAKEVGIAAAVSEGAFARALFGSARKKRFA
jgi:hypothetical protein